MKLTFELAFLPRIREVCICNYIFKIYINNGMIIQILNALRFQRKLFRLTFFKAGK